MKQLIRSTYAQDTGAVGKSRSVICRMCYTCACGLRWSYQAQSGGVGLTVAIERIIHALADLPKRRSPGGHKDVIGATPCVEQLLFR